MAITPVPSSGVVSGWQTPQRIGLCDTCGRLHKGQCRLEQNVCYRCGHLGHFCNAYPLWIVRASIPLMPSTTVQIEGPSPDKVQIEGLQMCVLDFKGS